jgi:Zn-dependent protease with chaperone function
MGLLAWAALAFCASFAAAWVSARIAIAPLRAAAAAPWVERARLAFPARATSRFAVLLLPAAYAVFAALPAAEPGERNPWVVAVAVAVPSLVATFLVRLSVERTVRARRVGAVEMLRGWIALWVVVYPHAFVALAGLALASDDFDARTCVALAATVVAVVAAFLGAGVALARMLGVARPAPERTRRAVDAAAAATGVSPRAVFEIDLAQANAFALPAPRWLLFTPEAARVLDDAQLAAIARHELGHVSEPPRVVVARATGAVVVVGTLVAARPIAGLVLSPDPGLLRLLVALLVMLGAVLFSLLVVRPLARRMEQRADAIARGHDAHDGEYARALEELYAANLMPAVTNVRGVHPHLYDRLVAAGAAPVWPRPAPPSRARLRAAMLACVGITVVTLTAAVQLAGVLLPVWFPR